MEPCRETKEDQQRGHSQSCRKVRSEAQSRGSQGKEETLLEGERKADRAGHTKKGGQTTQRVGEEKREIHRKDDDYIMQPPKWREIREEDAHRG